jgi:2-polyprenyl-6-methoxyphenol hydroxylase-like FAD-dependent oxidoreductase
MLLARDGHEVTLLERDSAPVPDSPDEAWERWDRGGVTQFRQAHYVQPRASDILRTELPEVFDALVDAGAVLVSLVERLPPTIADRDPRPVDARLVTATARRTTVEQVFAAAADREARLDVRRGVGVRYLLNGASGGNGIPHIRGAVTEDGQELEADLVVDAMGRRSTLPKWLEQVGCAPVHEEAEYSGFIYYSRFFKGALPEVRAPLLSPIGSISLLTLPGDADTWSVTVFIASGDRALKELRHPAPWKAAVRACPLQAHWLDGEPMTEILSMGGVIDRYRRFVADGKPVASGVAAVADAWACTNPSLGRGIALGLAHAVRLRDLARDELDDPLGFAEAWDEVTERELTPWYRSTVAGDRARLAEIDALRGGLEPPGPADFKAGLKPAIEAAAAHDADAFRGLLEIMGCITLPEEVFARPGLLDKVVTLAEQHPRAPFPGPSRDDLLRLVAMPAGA